MKSEKKDIFNIIKNLKFIDQIQGELDNNKHSVSVKTLAGSLPSLTIASLWYKRPRNFLIITSDENKAEEWLQNLSVLIDNDKLAFLSEPRKHVKHQ